MSLSCKPSIGWTRSVQSWAFSHHLVYVVPAIQLPAGLLVCWTSLHVSKWNLRQHKYNESTKCSAKHDSYASCWAITKCGVFATLLSNPANEVNNVAVLWCWQFLIQYSLCSSIDSLAFCCLSLRICSSLMPRQSTMSCSHVKEVLFGRSLQIEILQVFT